MDYPATSAPGLPSCTPGSQDNYPTPGAASDYHTDIPHTRKAQPYHHCLLARHHRGFMEGKETRDWIFMHCFGHCCCSTGSLTGHLMIHRVLHAAIPVGWTKVVSSIQDYFRVISWWVFLPDQLVGVLACCPQSLQEPTATCKLTKTVTSLHFHNR